MVAVLNYKSIKEKLEEAVSKGALHELSPSFPSDPLARLMLLHPAVDQFLASQRKLARIGRLRADLEAFVVGGEISLSVKPHEHGTAYMGILDPVDEGIWEIRSRDPNPGMRVFGQFPCKDIFIAFDVRLRSKRDPRWPDMVPLGDRNSFEYHYAQIEVKQRWDALFPAHRPIGGDDVSVLLSEKYHLI